MTEIPSPCVKICTMDGATGLCIGCTRSLDEIAGWSQFTAEQKLAVWRRINERRKGPGPPRAVG
ncbi:MAG TPA: DUF1289 domain-containing protein [Burkholderiales bacterium]